MAKCKHCDAKHLVADNLSKLDFGKGKVGIFNCQSVYIVSCVLFYADIHSHALTPLAMVNSRRR